MRKNFFIVLLVVVFHIFFVTGCNKKSENIYLSYGNSNEKCKVINISSSIGTIKEKYKNYDYLKIDKIIYKKKITIEQLNSIIQNTTKNQFKFGINFLDYNINLLSEEVNSNFIIDYNNNTISIENLNEYLETKDSTIKINDVSNVEIFSTESQLIENNKIYNLNLENGFHIKTYEDNDIISIINNSAARIISMINDDGSYIYSIKTNTNKEGHDYNILRHAGSTYSLIKYYKINPSIMLKEKIEKTIDYLLNNFTINYDQNIFVIEKKTSEIKLGGNALALLMLSEYQKVFNDEKYFDYSQKLANGIIYMQKKDGSFNHIYNPDLTLKETYRTIYYDGEATFALINLYDICKEKKLINAATTAINYFIDNNYESYRDHWQSYAINALLQYNNDIKYVKYAMNNYTANKENLSKTTSFAPIKLELLLLTLKSYNYSNAKNLIDINKLNIAIKNNKDKLLSYYIDKCSAMYFANPQNVIYGFHDIKNNFRMRIDDIQHSLLALMEYYFYINKY